MFGRVLTATILAATMGLATAQEPPARELWPPSKLDFGRPVEVARFPVDYVCSVFPVTLEFVNDQIHLIYMTGRHGASPALLYQKSLDGGRTWGKALVLDEASMAQACRDGDTLWIAAVCGDTAGLQRYGTAVKIFKINLKTGRTEPGRTILGSVESAPDETLTLGMVGVAARSAQLAVTIVEPPRRGAQPDPQETSFKLRLLVSTDTGATWQERPLKDAVAIPNTSIACWPMLRADDVALVLGTEDLALAEVDRRGLAQMKPLMLPDAIGKSADPLRVAADGKTFFMALAQRERADLARFFMTTSPDGIQWGRPIALTEPMPYGLITPFTHIAASGPNVLFGYTATTGEWLSGQTSAQALISRDAGRTFERIGLDSKFRHGSLMPVMALSPDGTRIGCVAVALGPNANERMDNNTPRGNFVGEAYLVFMCSPPLPPAPGPANAKRAPHIRELVRQLGSADYRQREQATAELHNEGEQAVPFLEQALQDEDLEIATRARMLLREAYPTWLNPSPARPTAP